MGRSARSRIMDSVFIQVTGPKSVLPEPKTGTGRMSMTWINFLNTVCGLQLEPASNYFICSSSYTITSQGGWTASLNDKIQPFIEKFTRKQGLYCVRLRTGQVPQIYHQSASASHPTLSTGNVVELPPPVLRIPIEGCPAVASSSTQKSSRPSSSQLNRRNDERDRMNGAGAEGGSRNVSDPSTSGGINQEANEMALVVYNERDEEEEEEQEQGDDQHAVLHQNERNILAILGVLGDNGEEEEEGDDGNASLPTTPASRQIEDIASRIARKLDGFDNGFLLKVKQEIVRLRENNRWQRNVKRSPMACYVLQQLFKD